MTISPTTMRDDMEFLASDELGGRIPGSPGHAAARVYIRDRMEEIGLVPGGDDGGYEWVYETNRRPDGDRMLNEDGEVVQRPLVTAGYNYIGVIPGSDPDLAHEHLVLMGHYDHLGVQEDGSIYNGAFDDTSGVIVALEVGRALLSAPPRRSVIILITDEEEAGLMGAERWIANPTIPIEDVVLGVSGDPLGRRILPDYGVILMAGFERSPELLQFWRQTVDFAESDVIFIHRRAIPVFASDQDEFHNAEFPVPAAWFINPGMTFYHTTDDTAETIDYRMMLDSARYIARSLIFAGNTDERWDYVGEPLIDGESALDFRGLPEGMLTSEVLEDWEREDLEDIIETANEAIEADSIDVVGNPMFWFIETVGFLAFELPKSHPGLVPPPFPGE
jgi:hypothetical protein